MSLPIDHEDDCSYECLIEKVLGLFANFDALGNVTQSIETIIQCPSNSSSNNIPEEFIGGLESLSTLLVEYTPADLNSEAIKELAFNVVELSKTAGCLKESQISTINGLKAIVLWVGA